MSDKVAQLFGYVEERCLWQYASRTWDRTANIEGVMGKAVAILNGDDLALATPDDRLFYADAKIMVADFYSRFPWIAEESPDQIRELLGGVKDLLIDTAITKSKNRELNHSLY
jgi:V-containing nitrogenase delta subunit